jgi:hypothetical protein
MALAPEIRTMGFSGFGLKNNSENLVHRKLLRTSELRGNQKAPQGRSMNLF